MTQKKRYTLTAAIGDALPGAAIELTDEQAESPLYASRIAVAAVGRNAGDVEDELEEYLAEGKASADTAIAEYLKAGQEKADALVTDATTKAAELVKEAEEKAAGILSAAQAEAMKLATAPKK